MSDPGPLSRSPEGTPGDGARIHIFHSRYDAEGHRISLTETPADDPATVTTFTYAGDAVVRETSVTGAATVTRTFTLDEAGAIVKMTRVTSGGSTADDGTYLVVWNGHGDAIELDRIDPLTGLLSAANRFSYSTWGTPTLATVGSFGDLGFRYRYVGRFDVQWDSTSAVPAGLLYMHARHYLPEIGRFLQPDPSAMEANLYGYAANSPVTLSDPSGLHPLSWQQAGYDFELRYARTLERFGYKVKVHERIDTSLGRRYIDIRATKNGVTTRIELKVGMSRYVSTLQFRKDLMATFRDGITTRVVRYNNGYVVKQFEIVRTGAHVSVRFGPLMGGGGGVAYKR